MERRLFGTNGIRGVANSELTPEFAMRVGLAVGTYFDGGRLLIGRDIRLGSQMVKRAVEAGLISAGATLYDAGVLPTPAFQYATKHYGLDGAVIITASHNPPQYIGIKVTRSDGVELPRREEIKIEEIFFEEKFRHVAWNSLKEMKKLDGVLDVYLEAVKGHVDVEAIRRRRFSVVVDPANSVGVFSTPRLLRELGCRVYTINAHIDGTFPGRPPEPRPENLTALSQTVRSLGADLGVAHDGDADRTLFSDETGYIPWGDKILALVGRKMLEEDSGLLIATPISTSTIVEDVAREYGGKVLWTRVGSVVVSHAMVESGAKLGGEDNGGLFYAPHQPVRDGAMTVALLLDLLAKEGKSLHELLEELPKYYIVKDRMECPMELKEKIVEELRSRVSGERIMTIDGVKVWFGDGSSILVRPSGTEPIFRFYAEGKTPEKPKQLVEEYKGMLKEIISELKAS